MEISESLAHDSVILFLLRREDYGQQLIKVLADASKQPSKICYLCINEPYSFVRSKLIKNNIPAEKFFFIDTLTKKVQSPPQADDCIFVSSPSNLTEISLALSKSYSEKNCGATLFDSISAMLIYETSHSIIQFVHNLLTKLRITGGKAYFIAIKDDINSDLVKDLHMFVDKVIDM